MSETGQCPAVVPAPDIRLTFGMFAIATILGSVLYGATLLQAGLYWSHSAVGDRKRNHILVTILVAFDTMAWVLETYTVWWYFVVNYANPAALGAGPLWALKLEPGFTYTVAFIAQAFFIEKIYLLTRNKVASAFMLTLSLAAWGTGLGITGLVFALDEISTPLIDHINIAQKTTSTLIEVLIATFMCYFFKSKQTAEVSRVTNGILHWLLVFALTRGVVMCLSQAFYTITYFAFQTTLVWVIFHFALSKLCTNSVIAALNARELLRGGATRFEGGNGSITLKRMGSSGGSGSRHGTHVVVSQPQAGQFSHIYPEKVKNGSVRVQFSEDEEMGHMQAVHVSTEYYKHSD